MMIMTPKVSYINNLWCLRDLYPLHCLYRERQSYQNEYPYIIPLFVFLCLIKKELLFFLLIAVGITQFSGHLSFAYNLAIQDRHNVTYTHTHTHTQLYIKV